MDITNQQIYDKLLHIEKLLKKEEQEEEKIIEEEKGIKELMTKKENKKFYDVMEWKTYIWENCSHRKHEMVSDTKIGFMCQITKKACDFLNCPENLIEKK